MMRGAVLLTRRARRIYEIGLSFGKKAVLNAS